MSWIKQDISPERGCLSESLTSEHVNHRIIFVKMCRRTDSRKIWMELSSRLQIFHVLIVFSLRSCVLSAQLLSCVWFFCSPTSYSPPGSFVCGISQARILSGWPFPPPEDLPDPGIELVSLMSPALIGRFFTTSNTWEALCLSLYLTVYIYPTFPRNSELWLLGTFLKTKWIKCPHDEVYGKDDYRSFNFGYYWMQSNGCTMIISVDSSIFFLKTFCSSKWFFRNEYALGRSLLPAACSGVSSTKQTSHNWLPINLLHN